MNKEDEKNYMKLFNKKNEPHLIVVYIAIAIYTVVFSCLSIMRYSSFFSTFDMGIMVQAVWNTSQGRILMESINWGYIIPRFWYAHWEFIYIPISFIYKIFSSPFVLLILQSFVLAIGALPVYWLAKDHTENPLSALFLALAYLFFPAMQNANLADVHGIVFSTSLLLFTFYFLQKRSLVRFAIFAFLALLCREDVALILFMMGVYSFIMLKERKLGIIVSVIGVLWFLVYIKKSWIRVALGMPPLVYPDVTAPSHWAHLSEDGGFLGVLVTSLTHPLLVLKSLLTSENAKYIIKLLAPVGFISVLHIPSLLLAAPTILINALSDYLPTKGIEAQYTATVTPFIFISVILGIKTVSRYLKKIHKSSVTIVAGFVLVMSILGFVNKSTAFLYEKWDVTAHHEKIEKIIVDIPGEASLCTDPAMGAHAAHRQRLFYLPDNMYTADYILYDFFAPFVKYSDAGSFKAITTFAVNEPILKLLKDQNYGICKYNDGITLFQKGYPWEAGIKNMIVASKSEVENFTERSFGPHIEFVGWQQPHIKGRFGTRIQSTFYWQATELVEENYQFHFTVLFNEEEIEFNHEPFFGLVSISDWKPETLYRDMVFIQAPKVINPGDRLKIYLEISDSHGEKIVSKANNPILEYKF